MKVINILPGFVDTEGLRAVFSDERSAGVMQQYGYGDIDSIRYFKISPTFMDAFICNFYK